jgi:DNA-binding Xre family transcriptional regulator
MLKFTFDRFFKAKGINKPYTFLIRAGFSENFATKMNNDRVKQINLVQLERLCLTFRCTPNDLFDWHPDKDLHTDEDHPLQKIRKKEKVIDMRNILHSIPMEELEEIEEFISEKRKANK